MKASTVCSAILSMVVVASAVPTANNQVNEIEARTQTTSGGASETCNANQAVSCCNTSNKQSSVDDLFGGILTNLNVGQCSTLPVNVLNILSGKSAAMACGNQNSVKCCKGNKNTGAVVVSLGECGSVL